MIETMIKITHQEQPDGDGTWRSILWDKPVLHGQTFIDETGVRHIILKVRNLASIPYKDRLCGPLRYQVLAS